MRRQRKLDELDIDVNNKSEQELKEIIMNLIIQILRLQLKPKIEKRSS